MVGRRERVDATRVNWRPHIYFVRRLIRPDLTPIQTQHEILTCQRETITANVIPNAINHPDVHMKFRKLRGSTSCRIPTNTLANQADNQDAECTLSMIPRGVAKNVIFVSRESNKKVMLHYPSATRRRNSRGNSRTSHLFSR